jgi:branched-chain amino acid transport system substrate-binding protein
VGKVGLMADGGRKPALAAAAVFGALALLVLANGCGGSGDSTDGASSKGLPDEIVIGAAIGKTGYMAPYDASIAALEQLVKETNGGGGIDGHKIKVIDADTRSEPQHAVVAVQQLIEEGADIIFFSGEGATAAASARVSEEHDLLGFAVVNEPDFGPPATGHLSFSSNPSVLAEASAMASFAESQGTEKPFLFRDTELIFGKAYCDGFQQAWERLGGDFAGSADFKNTDESVASQVGELKSSDADAVVMCSYPPGGAAAIKQIRAAGIDLPIYGSGAFDGTSWLAGIPDAGEVFFTSNGSAYDPPDRRTEELISRFKRLNINTDFTTNLLAVYAAGQLIVQSLRETESVSGPALADSLERRAHATILGPIAYSSSDHFATRVWPIYQLTDRRPAFIEKVEPEFVPTYGG